MLDLGKIAWGTLEDAYGEASGVSTLIKDLYTDVAVQPDSWKNLWSRLCHQGTVYSASYAAVPFLIDFALRSEKRIDYNLILLPVSIELARIQNADEVPKDLRDDYFDAISKLSLCVTRQISSQWDETFTKVCCAAVAISKGYPSIAEEILEMDVNDSVT